MATDYVSLEYVGDMPIPAGGFYPVQFPKAQEKYDAWNLHRGDGEYVVVPSDGLAVVSAELVWKAGPQTQVRDAILHNAVRVGTDRRPAIPTGNLITKTVQLRVKRGDTLALVVTHDSGQAQGLLEARLKVSFHALSTPPSRPVRVRQGTDPAAPNQVPEGPPNVGDGIPQTPWDPEG